MAEHQYEISIDGTFTFSGEHLNKVSHNQQVQKMIDNHTEVALSEVIGFVLILALITTAFSLYLVYGVPAQGRENEILHMGVIKDQFVEYKVGLDSLFTNNLVGTTTSNTFSLGTGGGYTQGANSIFPILSPVSSGGIFMINRRTTLPETLSITSNSYITGAGSFSVPLPTQANFTPNHVYVNISIPSSVPINSTGNFGLTVNTTKWIATVNLTPQSTYYQYYFMPSVSANTPCVPAQNKNGTAITTWDATYVNCLVPMYAYNYTGTDLTISITKGNILTMQNYPVVKNVISGSKYTVDLMDSSYGLNSATLPGDNIGLVVDQPLASITGTGNITYDFAEQPSYTNPPISLGAIEYRAANNYWIPRRIITRWGGCSSSSLREVPRISFLRRFLFPMIKHLKSQR